MGEVIGQIAGGIIVGPHFLFIIRSFFEAHPAYLQSPFLSPIGIFFSNTYPYYSQFYSDARFFTFIFLGLITFSLGEELHWQRIKVAGSKIALITIVQATLTLLLITLGFVLLFDFPLILALILGSIGIATAPALSYVLMNRFNIEGAFRNILTNVIVLDDMIEVVLFSLFLGMAAYICKAEELIHLNVILRTAQDLGLTLLIGFCMFIALWLLIREKRNVVGIERNEESSFLDAILSNHPTPSVEILFIVISIIAIGIGICMHLNLPFLLATISAGFFIANYHSHAVFDSLKVKNIMPMFNLFFFALVGAGIRVELFSLKALQYVLLYIILRFIGKYGGTWLACRFTKLDPKITASLPILMIPQAELAAVEVLLVAILLPGMQFTQDMVTTVVISLLVFQMGGAWCSEKTLLRWKNWILGEQDALQGTAAEGEVAAFKKLLQNRIIEIEPLDRKTTIDFICEHLYQHKLIRDMDTVINSTLERELLMSTAIGNGIAIPHCRLSSVTETCVVCAILKTPVDWHAPDKKPVDLVFLIVTPMESPELYLQTIKIISSTLRSTRFYEDIKTVAAMHRIDEYLKRL